MPSDMTRHPAGGVVEHADVGGSIGTRSIRHINRTKIKKEPIGKAPRFVLFFLFTYSFE